MISFDQIQFLRWHLSDKRFSTRGLAIDAGLSENALSKIFSADFNPTIKTLELAMKAVPNYRKAEFIGKWTWTDRNIICWSTSLTRDSDGRFSLAERNFDPKSVEIFEPDQLGPAYRYLLSLSVGKARLAFDKLDMNLAKAIAPECAVHLVDASPEDPLDFWAEIWDSSTGFGGGADLTNMTVREAPDPLYINNLKQKYLLARDENSHLFSLVARMKFGKIDRTFLRLAVCGESGHGLPKIAILTKPVEPSLAEKVIAHV